MKASRARALLRRVSPMLRMRWDWDSRARQNAQHCIACGHSETDASFWESGRKDLDEAVLRDVDLAPEACVLEIGCGIGRLLRPLSERVARAVGIDISREMIERARAALAGRTNVELFLTRGNFARVPGSSLDFVFSFIVFQHIPTKKAVSRYLREAARTLAGGGILRFQVDGRPRPSDGLIDTWLGVWYEPEEIRRELALTGFDVIGSWGERTHYFWLTARRRDKRGRPETLAAGARRRTWNREAVERFVTRLGYPPAEADSVVSGARYPRELADRFLDAQGTVPPDDFVRLAYRVLLGREADAGGLAFYAKEIASGIPPSNTVDCLIASSELEDQLRPVDTPAGD